MQTIEVDLTYTDPSSYHDVDPHYDELLPNGQPVWPASLRDVEFSNLRNLDAAEADGFFQSLVDSAPELKDLRRLSLKAILKVGWRDRARLREKWKMQLDRVFLRKCPSPSQFDSSSHVSPSAIAAHSLTESRAAGSHPASASEDSDQPDKLSPAMAKNRKSSRIAQKELESLSKPSVEGEPVAQSPWLSTADGPNWPDEENEDFVHGMVDEVVLRLDDQRPAESQWKEVDFLDSEQSDEDWDGT